MTTTEDRTETFGALLRRHRLAASLSQEALAERARVSAKAIAALERGRRSAPRPTTVVQLTRALGLSATDRGVLIAAASRARATGLDDRNRTTPKAAPGLRALHNLPLPTTSFVARAGEIAQVTERLRHGRLLTVTGSGGCGKTRLALEVGHALIGQFADGIWLVEFAPLADAALIPMAIATALGIHDRGDRPVVDVVTDYLRSRQVLLIVDNCEHVIDASAQIVHSLVRSCAGVQVLATSRELLGVAGEATWRVAPLSVVALPDRAVADGELVANVLASESGRLFVDRAQHAVPSFAVTPQNALAVAQVCQRLDGIPLAIELAAARLNMLSADQLVVRLDQRLRLLIGGSRTAAHRQQTLRATIDWSYELLSDEERALVRRFAVFAGGWSLEAAEALGADAAGALAHVFDVLSSLVAKSMVLVEQTWDTGQPSPRYRFLETIRQYAEEKLLESGEAAAVRTRHCDWYLDFAEQGLQGMEGVAEKRWWDRVELDYDNLRAALATSAANSGEWQKLLRLAALLGRFWLLRGFTREGIGWLELALARSDTAPSALRARALNWLAALEVYNGNVERARPLLEESIAHARMVGDRRVLSLALRHLNLALRSMGDQTGALQCIEEALAVSRDEGSRTEIAWNLGGLAANLMSLGDCEAVEPLLLECVAVARQSDNLTPVLFATGLLARLYLMRGELARARRTVREALPVARQLDTKLPVANLLLTLGDVALAEHDWHTAAACFRQALETSRSVAAHGVIAHALRHYASMCAERGDPRAAVRILGATSSICDSPDAANFYPPRAKADLLAAARHALGEEEFAVAWAEGQSLLLEHMVTEVLSSA